jgi:hypothetical protein
MTLSNLALTAALLALSHTAWAQGASSPASAASASPPTTQQALFKARCPGRVKGLLAAAIPGSPTSDEVVGAICECAQGKLGAAGELSVDQTIPKAVSAAALSCVKPVITAHNRGAVTAQFAPYLAQQGWKTAEVGQFATCFADQHWQDTFEAGLQSSRAKGSNLPTLWKQCTAVAGHADTPLPNSAPAAP